MYVDPDHGEKKPNVKKLTRLKYPTSEKRTLKKITTSK
jgi:hypothetical protein